MKGIIDSIKAIMEERSWTQTQLAEYSGLSFGQVNRMMNGKVEITPNSLQKIADALGMKVYELTEERDWYWWDGYEVTNLAKAEELKNFLCSLDQIENNNTDTGIADDLIHDPQKREAFKKDPQGYEFLFRLDYHYCRPRKD